MNYNWFIDTWIESYKNTYAHDANGNSSQAIVYEWEGGEWEEISKVEYQYMNELSTKDPLFPYFFEGFNLIHGNGQWMSHLMIYSSEFGDLEPYVTFTFHYSPAMVTSARSLAAKSIGLYPNPAAGQVTLDLSATELPANGAYRVALRTLAGQTVRAWTQSGTQAQFSVAGLPASVYLVEVLLP